MTAATAKSQRTSEAYRECPLCLSPRLEYEFVVEGARACACQGCGLLFLNPAPAVTEDASSRKDQFEITEPEAQAIVEQLVAYSRVSNGRLLVVEGGSALATAGRRLGFETISRQVEDAVRGDLPAVDVCILFRTLEKASDPVSLLQSIRGAMTAHGALLVVSATASRRAGERRAPQFSAGSRFCFCCDTLQNVLLRTEFSDFIVTTGRSPGLRSGQVSTFLARPTLRRAVPLLSVIIAVYNEKQTFTRLMDQLLEKTIEGVEIEIVVVESNSTDGTREDVCKYAHHPRVRILFEERPLGKGHAVRAGLKLATGDLLLFQDADLEYDLNDYAALIRPILEYRTNFVLGSRHNASENSWKIRRFTDSAILAAYLNLGHVLFLALFNFLYKASLTDPFTMFKVFRRECIYGVKFECDRFDFDNEIVIKLLRKGYTALEVPVNYVSRSYEEGKKVTLFGDALRWLRALVRYKNAQLYEE